MALRGPCWRGFMIRGYEIALWGLLLIAALWDLKTGKIPNRLTFPFMLLGLFFQFTAHGIAGVAQSGLAIGAAFTIFFPLYAIHAMGAGDAKLLMAAASFMDVASSIRLGIISILVGAGVGLFILVAQRGKSVAIASIRNHLSFSRPPEQGMRIPFAPALLCSYILIEIGGYYSWFH